MSVSQTDIILQVKDLVTSFTSESLTVRAVDGVSFTVPRHGTLGIVGESGCGKSVTALSVMRLLPKPAGNIQSGQILYDGKDLTKLAPEEMHRIRGRRISMIFQEPMTALNPVLKVGRQLGEVFQMHFPEMSEADIRVQCIDLMKRVGIPSPEKRVDEYPHQLSGGMRQRVMIAMALACKPDILIADEPTTALDVTIQAQILDLMRDLQQEYGMSIIFITHDLGVVAEMCHEVMVMYAGRVAEQSKVDELFANPKHPYTKGLLSSIPRLDTPRKSKLKIIEGMVPALHEMPKGCRFQNRCPYASEECLSLQPPLKDIGNDHLVSCFNWKKA